VNYTTLKLIHISAVTLSLCGFLARGIGVLFDAWWVRLRLARTLPHVIDSVLLASALGMLWVIRLPPWPVPWLRAKIVGLIVYIALGLIALKPPAAGRPGRSPGARLLALIAALAVFGYIVSVALTKDPLGALAWLK
jgi:uncharacterized membrane protein SirB2